MTRDIRGKKLAERTFEQKVYVKTYGGSKAGDMKHHTIASLKYKPNHIILHCGTNDIRTRKSARKIAEKIVNVCDNIKRPDNQITISGIIYRGKDDENEKVDEVNRLLQQYASQRGHFFLDNSNIGPNDLQWDGLHLYKSGNDIFFNNLLQCIND